MFESTKIIAYKQYYKARQLFLNEDQRELMQLRGPVRFVHEYIDMTKQTVPLYKSVIDLARTQKSQQQQQGATIEINSTYSTCQAGLGYSFAAGTTDGPGAFDFQQADTASSRYWNMVRDFLRRPSQEQIKCHSPKPILLSTGEMDFPYMWHPRVIPTQIFMIGQLAIVGLPGEFTTMAGRRVRQAVLSSLQDGVTFTPADSLPFEEDADDAEENLTIAPITTDGGKGFEAKFNKKNMSETTTTTTTTGGDLKIEESSGKRLKSLKRNKRAYSLASEIKVVLSGLSNIYSSYITTLEEYQIQRYEGASTLYGPHTLQAYINQFKKLAAKLIAEEDDDDNDQQQQASEVQPPDLTKSLFTLRAGVIFDGHQNNKKFGDVVSDVNQTKIYKCNELVKVSFVAGNPRNDLRHEDSFLYVDKYLGNGTWLSIATDANWETKFIWERTNTILGESQAKIEWEIPHNCESGVYRIRHYGASKNILQSINQYSGQSTPFRVLSTTNNISDNNLDNSKTLDMLNRMLESAKQFSKTASNVSGQKRFESEHYQIQTSSSPNDDTKNQQQRPSLYLSTLHSLTSIFGNLRHALAS